MRYPSMVLLRPAPGRSPAPRGSPASAAAGPGFDVGRRYGGLNASYGALTVPPAEVGAHACWCFDDDDAFLAAAVAYLADGITRRERVVYVADRPADAMRGDVAPLGDVERLVGDGTLVLS